MNKRRAIRSSAWSLPAQYLGKSATVNAGEFCEGYQAQLEEIAPLTDEHSELFPQIVVTGSAAFHFATVASLVRFYVEPPFLTLPGVAKFRCRISGSSCVEVKHP
jgi:hypothetical protein